MVDAHDHLIHASGADIPATARVSTVQASKLAGLRKPSAEDASTGCHADAGTVLYYVDRPGLLKYSIERLSDAPDDLLMR
ncbi:MAG TPA: hypothetical protein VLI90_05900, partial [Tepidisphaeraceae bacterium]|nr:hypothetical protein [Tepidisphaeraceae bacterium]